MSTKADKEKVEVAEEVDLFADETPTTNKRGWIFDQLMIVGDLENSMGHSDEQICNLYSDMEVDAEDPKKMEDDARQLNLNYEIIKIDYENRVDALNQIFDAVEGSDRHYYCQVKHRAAAYCKAGENFHARGCSPEAERILVNCGKALALTCAAAFGFEPMSCLRCLDEALSSHLEKGKNGSV